MPTINEKAFVSYLADNFEKLNVLNKQLQGKNKILLMQNKRYLTLFYLSNYVKNTFLAKILISFIH